MRNMESKLSIKKVPTPDYWRSRGRPSKFPELEAAIATLGLNETIEVQCLGYHVSIKTRNTYHCPIVGRALHINKMAKDYKLVTMHENNQLYIKKVERKK